jgi:serine/threonine protein kinase
MKAVITAVNTRGDDEYFNRLFTYLQKEFKGEIIKLIPIRQSVFYLETKSANMIIKGYRSFGSLRLQETFTATLKSEGFNHSYRFLMPPGKDTLVFDGLYWGCIEYLHPYDFHFSYGTHSERQAALELISQYHAVTKKIVNRYKTIIPPSMEEQKWRDRTFHFIQNITTLKNFLKEEIITEMINWANWSLEGLAKYSSTYAAEPNTILHGDVAHHNFLRDREGQLKLIDFDLIRIGPPKWDFIQLANRILPFLGWSMNRLSKYEQMQKYIGEIAFLYALAFPADIFREWNRIIKEKTYLNPEKIHQITELTLGQFYMRQKFFQDLKLLVDNNNC